jgi:hypothetical protein
VWYPSCRAWLRKREPTRCVLHGSGWGFPHPSRSSPKSLPRVKRSRRVVNNPPPSRTEVKERVELCLYSHSGCSLPVTGRTSPCTTDLIWHYWRYMQQCSARKHVELCSER